MLKRKVKKSFSDLLLLLAVFLSSISVVAQSGIAKDSCYISADAKKVPLFSKLSFLKKELSVHRYLDYPDTLIFQYGYDCKIRKYAKFTITSQLVFYVDMASKETIKQELYINIERGTESGNISKEELKKLLFAIKRQNLPFLLPPKNPAFGSSYKDNSTCYTYSLNISKVTNEYPANSWKEFTITVSIPKNDKSKK